MFRYFMRMKHIRQRRKTQKKRQTVVGGKDVFNRVSMNDFTYSLKETSRVAWVRHFYPHADLFLDAVKQIPWNDYSYQGECSYRYGNKIDLLPSHTVSSPAYYFLGGTVYELLDKTFKTPDLRSFTDPTSDIDIQIFPPKIEPDDLTKRNKIGEMYYPDNHPFYHSFAVWIAQQLQIALLHLHVDEIPDLDDFEMNEYGETLLEFSPVIPVGKMKIIVIFHDDNLKIQVVAKIKTPKQPVLDHVLEMLIPLPMPMDKQKKDQVSSLEFSPSGDVYDPQENIHVLTVGKNTTYNIPTYYTLFSQNMTAYLNRLSLYEQDPIKILNHSGRLFYLFELFYQHPELTPLDAIFLFKRTKTQDLVDLVYVNRKTNEKIAIPLGDLLNAYRTMFDKKPTTMKTYTHKSLFLPKESINEKAIHDAFIHTYFNFDNKNTKKTGGRTKRTHSPRN